MISTITYNGDGVTRVFPVSFEIKGEAYVVAYINDVAVSDKTKYDIINNSIVFVEGEAPVVGTDNVQIVVASTPTEIADLNAPPSSVQTVLDNLVAITNVANDLDNIDFLSSQSAALTTLATEVVPNIAEILQADNNAALAIAAAGVATTKASEAEQFRNEAAQFNLSNSFVVPTIDQLLTVPSSYTTAIVKDLDRGGIFIWSLTGTANGGTVFAGTTGYWYRQYEGAVNVKWFGAVANGVTPSSAIFNIVSSLFKNIEASGHYNIEDVVDIQDNQTWTFKEAKFTHTDDTKIMLRAVGKTGFSIVGSLLLQGLKVSVLTSAETGLLISGCKRYVISGIQAIKFKGYGINLNGGTNLTPLRGDRGLFNNISTHENTIGINVTAGAESEYNTWTNINSSGNGTGVKVGAGNNAFIGGSVVDNSIGVHLTSGSNHGHGLFSGVMINHNTTYNLQTDNVVNGFTFTGCQFYQGNIFFNFSKGIVLDGGHLDCAIIYNYQDANSGYNYIKNMYCPGGYGGMSLVDSVGDHPTQLIILNCVGIGVIGAVSTVSINDPKEVFVNVYRNADSLQALISGSTLIFDTEEINGDRRKAYNNTTGIFTVPVGQSGMYRVKAQMFFSGTSIIQANSYISLLKNTTDVTLSLVSLYGTSIASSNLETTLYLVGGDTLKLTATIAATSPNFGGSTWKSNLCIEKIS